MSGSELAALTPSPRPRSDLRKEFNLRRKEVAQQRVRQSEAEEFTSEGWTVEKDTDTGKVLLQRRKPVGERLEDRFWSALYKMGYDELNTGRKFNILVSKRGEPPIYKQVDVFSKDHETVIVAECKACESPRKRSLQKDLNEFIALKGPMANSIRKHYPNFKPKIIWMFVTENVISSKPDLERARQEQIQVMRESEYRYFSQIIDHLGSGARPQFLAEYLKGASISEMEGITTPAIRGTLGGQRFYSFVTTPDQLLKIAFVNHRALNDPEGAPAYQRLIQKTRLRQIAKFIGGGGYFPNSILINFKEKVRFDLLQRDDSWPVQFGTLYLPSKFKTAWIVDGQHRLYAYGDLDEKRKSDNLIVVAFERLDDGKEANLFVTINHEQKRVPKNLLDELEGELKWGSADPRERIGAIALSVIYSAPTLAPFLKWAGGKRWFADRHLNLLPDEYDRYIEPFLGSGAIFFSQNQRKAILSDLNVDLISTYKAIRNFPKEVESVVLFHHYSHSDEYYYKTRAIKPADEVELAGWFLYLNRTCWNGLYRVNKKNQFNVPRGTKSSVRLPSDNFPETSKRLRGADLYACDFEETICRARANDFVFVDPTDQTF